MAACIAGSNISGQGTDTTNLTIENNSAESHVSKQQQELLNNADLVKISQELLRNDALTDIYEYEDAGIKILKYFGIPIMAGMVSALACFVLVIQD